MVPTLVLLLVALASAVLGQQDNIVGWENPPITLKAGDNVEFAPEVDVGHFREVISASFELMAGRAEDGGNDVVDIILINALQTPETLYYIPANMPAGTYHVRTNATTNSTLTSTTAVPVVQGVQHVTGRSPDFTITAAEFDCATPPPWSPNITSPTDPNFHLLRISSPMAGEVWAIPAPAADAYRAVLWDYLDGRTVNALGNNVTNLTFEWVLDGSTDPLVSLVAPSTSVPGSLTITDELNHLKPGAYRIRATYTSPFENGGAPSSALSQPYYLQAVGGKCTGLSVSSSSSGISASGRAGRVRWSLASLMLGVSLLVGPLF